jgi:hypothetical protein
MPEPIGKLDQDFFKEQFRPVTPIDIVGDLPVHPTKKYKLRELSDIKRIVVHTTDWRTSPKTIAIFDIEPNHISKTGCPAITYHEMVMDTGLVYHCLPFRQVSWHAGIWNPGSLALAMVFRVSDSKGRDVHAPSENLLKTTQTRLGQLCLELGLTPDKVVGHRELKGTGWFFSKGSRRLRKTCPGLKVDLDLLRTNVAKYMQIILKLNGAYKGEIDGDFGPLSRGALTFWKAR